METTGCGLPIRDVQIVRDVAASICTCRSDPRRPWEWSETAMRMDRG